MAVALAILVLMLLASAAFLVVGVYMLVGMAWAFIAVALLLFGAAIYLRSGLKSNG